MLLLVALVVTVAVVRDGRVALARRERVRVLRL